MIVELDERKRYRSNEWFELSVHLDDGTQYNAKALRTESGSVSVYSVWRNGASRETARRAPIRKAIEQAVGNFIKEQP